MNNIIEKIPKKIHYCWFGKNPKSELINKCINSWKQYLPDYEIIEWNEDNFDFNCNAYVAEAYRAKKWAFVADYVRLWAVYNFGGIYFDTDVELIKSIDKLLCMDAFFCYEKEKINTGLGFGSCKHNKILKELMDIYDKKSFLLENGKYDLTTCVNISKAVFENFLGEFINPKQIVTLDNVTFFPDEYFCPLDYDTRELKITDNTYAIHWYGESWLPSKVKFIKKIKSLIRKIIGDNRFNYIKKFLKR